MVTIKSCVRVLLTLSLISLSAISIESRAEAPAIDPNAVQILREMTTFMSNLQQFSVHTQNTIEDRLGSGQRVDFDVSSKVVVRRPNKIYAERFGPGVRASFYYNGETLTLDTKTHSEHYYATMPVPGTIEELLDFARENLGMVIPVSDLVYGNSYAILMQNVVSASPAGITKIGNMSCYHLIFRRTDVDFQIWVADSGPPLPCKFVVTDTSTPELISTAAVMSNWNLEPNADEALFHFTPPEGAQATEFILTDDTSDSSPPEHK